MYLIIFTLLLVMELVFFKFADKYNIIDKPNHRSAHTEITLRGGGIIFWFAALLYFVQNTKDNYLFFIGITLVSLISFGMILKVYRVSYVSLSMCSLLRFCFLI